MRAFRNIEMSYFKHSVLEAAAKLVPGWQDILSCPVIPQFEKMTGGGYIRGCSLTGLTASPHRWSHGQSCWLTSTYTTQRRTF